MNMKIANLTKEEMNLLIEESISINQILKKLNVASNGSGAYKTFKNHCVRLGIEPPVYENKGNSVIGPKIDLKDILVENSSYQNMQRLKKRLVNEKILEYECSGNGCTVKDTWLGNKVVLHLDHKNGNHNDNRIENLRFLCPNCHSQTDTYSGKNNIRK